MPQRPSCPCLGSRGGGGNRQAAAGVPGRLEGLDFIGALVLVVAAVSGYYIKIK